MIPFARIVNYGNIAPGLPKVVDVVCGYEHYMFLSEDGDVYVKGLNSRGQCGTGDTAPVERYTKIMSNARYIQCGDYTSFIVLKDNTLLTCGDNKPLGTNNYQYTFVARAGMNSQKARADIIQIGIGSAMCSVLFADQTLWSVGQGAIGTGAYIPPASAVTNLTNVRSNITDIAVTVESLWARDTSNSVYAVGEMWALNLPTTANTQYTWAYQRGGVSTPSGVKINAKYRAINYPQTDGTYSGGQGIYGQLGNNVVTDVQGNRVYPITKYNNGEPLRYNEVNGLTYVSIIVQKDAIHWSGNMTNGNVGNGNYTQRRGTFISFVPAFATEGGGTFDGELCTKIATNAQCSYMIYNGELYVTGTEYGGTPSASYRTAMPIIS